VIVIIIVLLCRLFRCIRLNGASLAALLLSRRVATGMLVPSGAAFVTTRTTSTLSESIFRRAAECNIRD